MSSYKRLKLKAAGVLDSFFKLNFLLQSRKTAVVNKYIHMTEMYLDVWRSKESKNKPK